MLLDIILLILVAGISGLISGTAVWFSMKDNKQKAQQRSATLETENMILLQQLSTIKEEQAYSGSSHHKEVQQAFLKLEHAIQHLRVVCKQEPSESEKKNQKKLQPHFPLSQVRNVITGQRTDPNLAQAQIKIAVITSNSESDIEKESKRIIEESAKEFGK